MANDIDRNTFVTADNNTRLLIMYDMLSAHIERQAKSCERRQEECDSLFLKLERRRKLDTGVSVASGVFGGAIAVLAKMKLWE